MENKKIIVAGGSKGIGQEVIKNLLVSGVDVINLDISPSDLCETYITNLTDIDALKLSFEKIKNKFATIDGLAIIAGVGYIDLFSDLTIEKFNQQINNNLHLVYYISHFAVPIMNSSSAIVTIGSTSALGGPGASVAYVAAKAGVVGLTKGMAYELANKGIKVNCVIPGPTGTGLLSSLTTATERRILENVTPSGRITKPEEVAHLITYLVLNSELPITGQAIAVDGGLSLAYKPALI